MIGGHGHHQLGPLFSGPQALRTEGHLHGPPARPDRVDRLAVVPDATHLFPEAGALSQVTDLAAGWLGRHFARTDAIAPAA